MKLTRVGVDLAKNIFQLHGVDRAERPVWCKRLRRSRWIEEVEQNVEPGAEIGMEACGGALGACAAVERLRCAPHCAAVREAVRQEQQD